MSDFFFRIDSDFAGERIDKTLSDLCSDFTRSHIQHIIDGGEVRVNGNPVSKSFKVSVGDEISFSMPELKTLEAKPENIPLDIVYEDDDLLVVNKPRGMVVHPAAGNYDGTLVNALLYHCGSSLSGINGVIRPGIVHRIDKNTSGLLIVAKNDFAHEKLAAQIKEHSFTRQYRAVVHGHFKELSGTVNAPIGRNPNDRKKMCVIHQNSKDAVSHYEVLSSQNGLSLVKLLPETGRTHQLRVHMASIGHPLAGDWLYGTEDPDLIARPALHSYALTLTHPVTGEVLHLTAPLPEDLARLVAEP